MLIVPDIAGFVGADTLGCLLATGLYEKEALTLLVDIGTNGEMVLGNRDRMIACSTAAGPALEGANIRFGMRAAAGAIDHVWLEKGKMACSVIGGGTAKGICGSGIIDAIAMGLKLGLINQRGRILTEDRILRLTDTVYLTQEDIRQVQQAKGAICAGARLLAEQLGVALCEIQKVQLAGAFGSFLNPENACRIGLLPEELRNRIEAVGNAALSGAKKLACDQKMLPLTQKLTEKIRFLELASLSDFSRTFALSMRFREEDPLTSWLQKAKEMGFDTAVSLDPEALTAREDVRAMCEEDKCGAYNKTGLVLLPWARPSSASRKCGSITGASCCKPLDICEKLWTLSATGKRSSGISETSMPLRRRSGKSTPMPCAWVPGAAGCVSSAPIPSPAGFRKRRCPAWRATACL